MGVAELLVIVSDRLSRSIFDVSQIPDVWSEFTEAKKRVFILVLVK